MTSVSHSWSRTTGTPRPMSQLMPFFSIPSPAQRIETMALASPANHFCSQHLSVSIDSTATTTSGCYETTNIKSPKERTT